jgi:DNA polymerase III delta prime subunit
MTHAFANPPKPPQHQTGVAPNIDLIPWVEKYRPSNFEDIVLLPLNKKLFKNILETDYFPNLLFYGPPGTGKTTTIINLINEYQVKHNNKNKSSVIHLNASDERGIDIIRNQINQFVKSLNLFETGLKFVILDEVDYMTKNAQQALKYLLQTSTYNVRFCLICNYITKIDESLKNEFICVRFNQLQSKDIHQFIKSITVRENLNLTDDMVDVIHFIQLNQNLNLKEWTENIMNPVILDELYALFSDEEANHTKIIKFIHASSIRYNTDKRTIIQKYLNYVIRKHIEVVSAEFLNIVQIILHNTAHMFMEDMIVFFVFSMKRYMKN